MFFLLATLFFSITFGGNAFSASLGVPFQVEENDEQWRLTADYLTTLDNGAIIEARGDVVLQRGEDVLKAEFARYYTATDWVFVRENVYVKLGRDELRATEAEIDLLTSTGFLKNGNVFMAGPHVYFEGEHVKKYFGDKYSFVNATITSCDPADPAWGLKASSATVEIDGYATLSRANFTVGDADLPAVPYLLLPVKVERQSGLLRPDFGISSLHGVYYTQPWFWAIDDERDATFYGSFFTNSGLMLSAEYRSNTSSMDKNWFAADYLLSTSDEHDDRFWLRGMSDGNILDSEWKYKLNVDYASDDTFLLDYDNTLTGFDETQSSVLDFFGRDFAEISRNRLSEGYIYRKWEYVETTLGFQYSQDPRYGDTLYSSTDPTVQKLPEANLFVYPVGTGDIPLQFEGSATATYNYRRFGSSGMKTELAPQVSVPLDLKYFTVLGQLGLNHRNYFAGSNSVTSAPLEGGNEPQRNTDNTLLNAKIETATQFAQVWNFGSSFDNTYISNPENLGESEIIAFRHLLEPRVTYSYLEDKDQSHLPYYSLADRIIPHNDIDLSFRNVFTAKEQSVVKGKDDIALLKTSFRDIALITLSGGYDFNEASRTNYLDEFERRPFKDITLEAEFNAFGLGLYSRASYSLYGDGFTRVDLGTSVPTFSLEKYFDWSLAYSYRHEMYDYQNIIRYATSSDISLSTSESLLRNTFTIRPASFLNFVVDHYIDLEDKDKYEVNVVANYIHDCYIISADYSYTPNEQTYGMSLILPGIFE